MVLPLFRPQDRGGCLPIAYFHAMARLGIEGVVVVEPQDIFVSVGYFDDTEAVIDVDRCRKRGIPILRREIGGGPVLLGPGQVFYNVVLKRNDPRIPKSVLKTYEEFSKPIVATYDALGVKTAFKAVNDLVVKDSHKKISGQGAADIGDMFCFVGAILRDFDTALMAQVIKVPEEKFRDKLQKTLEENVTSISKELLQVPSRESVEERLITELASFFGDVEIRPLPTEVVALAHEVVEELQDSAVVYAPRSRRYDALRIREGVTFRAGLHKAVGGLIRAKVVVEDEVIKEVFISGDFTIMPKGGLKELESFLRGVPFVKESVTSQADRFLHESNVEIPGVSANDLAEAIVGG